MRDINKYETEYLSTDFEQSYQVPFRRKKVLESISKYNPKSILEVGCGMQTLALYVPQYEKFTIVEPGTVFLNKAKQDLSNDARITYVQGFLEDKIDILKSQQSDMIIVSSLLHEVEFPLKLLNSVKELCHNNTVIHINVPNELSLHRILAYESGLIEKPSNKSERNIALQQNNIFNLNTLENIITQSGNISICDKGSYFLKPFTHKQMERCLEYNIIDEKILEGFYNIVKYFSEYGSEIYIDYKYNM